MEKTAVVTVTYGKRLSLVSRVVEAAIESGASKIFVVNNAAELSPQEILSKQIASRQVCVIENYVNEGSAVGFAMGIAAVLQSDAKYVLLLDDDNVIGPDFISEMQRALQSLGDSEKSAAVGFRANHGGSESLRSDKENTMRQVNSFLGFHIFDLGKKLRKRLLKVPPNEEVQREVIEVNKAPYGGLFLPVSLVKQIGLPDANFVLYEDDTEYSARIIKNGGKIILVRDQLVEDIDISWTAVDGPRSAALGWLWGGPDFRVFYTMRNHSYLDIKYRAESKVIFLLNVVTYAVLLISLAIITGRFKRARLIVGAMRDGLTGKLGKNSRYMLP